MIAACSSKRTSTFWSSSVKTMLLPRAFTRRCKRRCSPVGQNRQARIPKPTPVGRLPSTTPATDHPIRSSLTLSPRSTAIPVIARGSDFPSWRQNVGAVISEWGCMLGSPAMITQPLVTSRPISATRHLNILLGNV